MKKILTALLFCLFVSVPALSLDLGDNAIALDVDQWVTGEPVDPTVVDSGHFYLVEVWSVTCPPCVTSIPLMNDIQKRYADQGLRIVSFTSDDINDVRPFLEQHPIEYSSFIDKEGGSTVSYMAADNRNTIPHAFLFDKAGVLVWIGNPLDNLEARIQDVLSGKLNGARALAIRKARDDFQAAAGGQDAEAMLSALRELETLEPENSRYFAAHYSILTELGGGGAEEVKALYRKWFAAAGGHAERLMHLSLFALEQGLPEVRDPAIGLAAAKAAYELGGVTRLQAGMTLAEAYRSVGRIDLSNVILAEMVAGAGEGEEREAVRAIADYFKLLEETGKNPDAYKPE